jgi:hypothetical protein
MIYHFNQHSQARPRELNNGVPDRLPGGKLSGGKRGAFMGNFITYLSLGITAIATGVIALYAVKSHKLADKNYQLVQEIKKANELKTKSDDEFHQDLSDLYTAMVISNIYSSDSGLEERIKYFKKAYKGNVLISL